MASSTAPTAKIIDGKALAQEIREEIAKEVQCLSRSHNEVIPGLAMVIVGSRKDSWTYISLKKKACEEVGMHSFVVALAEDVSLADVVARIRELNADPIVHVHKPLPLHTFSQELKREKKKRTKKKKKKKRKQTKKKRTKKKKKKKRKQTKKKRIKKKKKTKKKRQQLPPPLPSPAAIPLPAAFRPAACRASPAALPLPPPAPHPPRRRTPLPLPPAHPPPAPAAGLLHLAPLQDLARLPRQTPPARLCPPVHLDGAAPPVHPDSADPRFRGPSAAGSSRDSLCRRAPSNPSRSQARGLPSVLRPRSARSQVLEPKPAPTLSATSEDSGETDEEELQYCSYYGPQTYPEDSAADTPDCPEA